MEVWRSGVWYWVLLVISLVVVVVTHWSSDIIAGIKMSYEPGLEMTPGNPQIGCKQRAG